MDKKVALVTGASRGIGRAVALELAANNIHVIALARTIGALEALDDDIQKTGGSATLIPQDLLKLEALDELGPALYEKFGKLDILIANAGMLGTLGPLAHADPKDIEKVFKVNLFANQRLIRTLDPLLQKSEAAHVVTITTSERTIAGRAYWGVYGASKAGLLAFTNAYAEEVAQTNIKVHAYNPGAVRTSMREAAMPGEDPETLPPPEDAAKAIVQLVI